MILILLFVFSFEINKVNPFLALTAPFPLIFLPNLFIAFESQLLTNPSKLSLAKGIARCVMKKSTQLNHFRQLRLTNFFISVDIILAMVFLILVVCLVARNNSCSIFSS